MFIDRPKTIFVCGLCGSTNIGRPMNNDRVDIECMDCGHRKMKSVDGSGIADWHFINKPRRVEF